MVVSFEAPYKKKEFNARDANVSVTKNQCMRPYRCVKCGKEHPTTVCTKNRNENATCVNCEGKHPASYRGCQKYKQYKEQILKLKPPQQKTSDNLVSNIDPAISHNKSRSTMFKTGLSYAEAIQSRGDQAREQNTEWSNNHQDFSNIMETMFATMEQLMNTMMDNMMDRMIQLVTQITNKQCQSSKCKWPD